VVENSYTRYTTVVPVRNWEATKSEFDGTVSESEFKSRQILRLRYDSLDHISIHIDTTLLDGQDGQISLSLSFGRNGNSERKKRPNFKMMRRTESS
jgi:alkylated DNA repair dioxygenase AlkB